MTLAGKVESISRVQIHLALIPLRKARKGKQKFKNSKAYKDGIAYIIVEFGHSLQQILYIFHLVAQSWRRCQEDGCGTVQPFIHHKTYPLLYMLFFERSNHHPSRWRGMTVDLNILVNFVVSTQRLNLFHYSEDGD